MDKDTALSFLSQHQPMPPDSELTEELLVQYDEIRKFCIENPDPECIPLFLNSFGEGTGFGVYQLVDDVLRQFHPKDIVMHLVKALRSSYHSVRGWAAQLAMQFPQPELMKPLEDILFNYDEDSAIRSWAAISISFIDDPLIDGILERALRHEQNPKVRNDIINAIKKRPDALAATRREQAVQSGN